MFEVAASGLPLVTWLEYWDAFWGLSVAWRVASVVGVTVALAAILVGLFPAYGKRGAERA
jgi:anti-sigma-K factor RskA